MPYSEGEWDGAAHASHSRAWKWFWTTTIHSIANGQSSFVVWGSKVNLNRVHFDLPHALFSLPLVFKEKGRSRISSSAENSHLLPVYISFSSIALCAERVPFLSLAGEGFSLANGVVDFTEHPACNPFSCVGTRAWFWTTIRAFNSSWSEIFCGVEVLHGLLGSIVRIFTARSTTPFISLPPYSEVLRRRIGW